MLTGSMAMIFYAVPRMTRNIDLVVECRSQETPKLLGLFSGDLDFPWFRRHSVVAVWSALKRLGTYVANMTMATSRMIEHFDVIEHICLRFLDCMIDLSAYPFLLQRAEKELSHGVVPAKH
jgi:hypothetical protein